MAAYRAQLAVQHTTVVEQTVTLRLRVRNIGGGVWPASAIRLAYQVLDEAAESLIEEGRPVAFPADIAPDAESQVELTVELPSEPGQYRVWISPLEEGVAWFYERGSDWLELAATVDGEGGVTIAARAMTRGRRLGESLRRRAGRLLVAPFATLFRHRALIASMVRRDIQGRYRGSMAGLFWTVIHPLLLMFTYFFIFALVLKVRFGPNPETAGPIDFLLYFVCGMLPWLAFNEALGRAPSVMLEHRNLVTRVIFPVEILPANLAFTGLVSGFFALLVFLGSLLYFGHGVPATALYLPAVLVPQVLLTIGLCWFLAALGVFLRDTGQFMAFLLTLWFFATPICYPESALPASAAWLFEKNPVFVLVRAYRAIFLERSAPAWPPLAGLAAAGLAAFMLGYGWFVKSRKSFADVL